jgi:putative ABC transport system substrate-binding protein
VSNRRAFLLILAASALARSRRSDSQPASRLFHIGYLSGGSAKGAAHLAHAFRDGLRELGWTEGARIVIDYRFAEGRVDRLPALAAELVHAKVDVLVAGPSPPAVAARNATRTIPVVMVAVGDPVGQGLVASLARPGGNVTGMSFDVGLESFGKSLEILGQIIPGLRRVAVLLNPANPAQALAARDLNVAAGAMAVALTTVGARSPEEFDVAFAAIAKANPQALLVVTDSLFILHRERLAVLTSRHRLPSMHGAREHVEAGGLVAYGPKLTEVFRRAATFVDRILNGARPGELPVEQPSKFELVVNMKVARNLGLTIPSPLLVRADELIE